MVRHPQSRQQKIQNAWIAEKEAMRKFIEKDLKLATVERAAGITDLKKHGVSVFKEKEEWELETAQERRAWGRVARRLLLDRGPEFRWTPDDLGIKDKNIGIFRAIISMTTKIRWGLKHDRFDKEPSEIDKWEKRLGVKEGVYKRVERDKCETEEAWKDRWEEEKMQLGLCK